MRRFIYSLTLAWGIGLAGLAPAYSQTGAGSSTADNSVVTIAAGTTELRFSEISYFGPNTQWEINGTLEIWSKRIWISPTARFTGNGTIIIHDPGTNPYYEGMTAGPTQIDGNDGFPILTKIQLKNPHNLILTDITDPGYGINNPSGSKTAALNVGGIFEFAVDNGDVVLNGNDFGIGLNGALLGYTSKRMIVTGNSISGHVIKQYGGTVPFLFPVGIAEEDYTPATLTPSVSGILYVSVQDYTQSGRDGLSQDRGMDRVWHVFADKAMTATYTLQHRTITNGNSYVDATAQIRQYAGSGNWVGGSTTLVSQAVHTRQGLATYGDAANDGSWFTKMNAAINPPIATNDTKEQVLTGTPIQINVLENDLPGSSPIVVGSVKIIQPPANGTVRVNPDGSITYISNNGFVGEDTFIYEITDENGLTSRATVTVKMISRPFFIPNVITPNGDGKNDYFVIVGSESFDRIEVEFYNRWGNQVHIDRNYKNNWKGDGLNEGTYYFKINLLKGNQNTLVEGWVLIKR